VGLAGASYLLWLAWDSWRVASVARFNVSPAKDAQVPSLAQAVVLAQRCTHQSNTSTRALPKQAANRVGLRGS
jgi:hypothetical protein